MDDLGQNTRLAVLMFTDIVDSVRIKHRHGVASYERLIRRHDELFYNVLASIPSAVCLKDTGDGFLSSFGTASEAVNAALRFQYALSREAWNPEPLRVRTGVHLGEVSELEDEASGWPKIVGLTADIAARVMGLAEGGQILLTRPVYDNARQYVRIHPTEEGEGESEGEGLQIEWKAHGRYVFKGSTEPMEIFEIGAVGVAPFTTPPDQDKARRVSLDGSLHGSERPDGANGRRVGNYQVGRKIDAGGAAAVYRAEHVMMMRPVALKAPSGQAAKDALLLERFRREIETAARINHPNMVTAHDAGEHRGVPYLVMSYVEGLSLSQIAHGGGRLPPQQAINCILHVARGLAHAHRRGVVLRALTPRNVLIDREGRVRMVGLNTARLMEDTGTLDRRLHERFALSRKAAQYAAPELTDDPDLADPRSDIYSLGCLLFRVLTGRTPFLGEKAEQIREAHYHHPIPKLTAELARVPEGLQEILVGTLAKTLDDRYQSMASVISDLMTVLPGAPAHRLLLDTTQIVSGSAEAGARSRREGRPSSEGGKPASGRKTRQGPIPIAQPRGS